MPPSTEPTRRGEVRGSPPCGGCWCTWSRSTRGTTVSGADVAARVRSTARPASERLCSGRSRRPAEGHRALVAGVPTGRARLDGLHRRPGPPLRLRRPVRPLGARRVGGAYAGAGYLALALAFAVMAGRHPRAVLPLGSALALSTAAVGVVTLAERGRRAAGRTDRRGGGPGRRGLSPDRSWSSVCAPSASRPGRGRTRSWCHGMAFLVLATPIPGFLFTPDLRLRLLRHRQLGGNARSDRAGP